MKTFFFSLFSLKIFSKTSVNREVILLLGKYNAHAHPHTKDGRRQGSWGAPCHDDISVCLALRTTANPPDHRRFESTGTSRQDSRVYQKEGLEEKCGLVIIL